MRVRATSGNHRSPCSPRGASTLDAPYFRLSKMTGKERKRDAGSIRMPLENISGLTATKPSIDPGCPPASTGRSSETQAKGILIVNADDWGRNHETTERISECILRGTVSSVSAMVFMEDSERAAAVAKQRGIDAGLHLNLTTSFSAAEYPSSLRQHHERLAKYLLGRRVAQAIYHPGLTRSFEYVVSAQLDEYRRLYGQLPGRIDGHHHMHLCTNILLAKLLPRGTIVAAKFFIPVRREELIQPPVPTGRGPDAGPASPCYGFLFFAAALRTTAAPAKNFFTGPPVRGGIGDASCESRRISLPHRRRDLPVDRGWSDSPVLLRSARRQAVVLIPSRLRLGLKLSDWRRLQ